MIDDLVSSLYDYIYLLLSKNSPLCSAVGDGDWGSDLVRSRMGVSLVSGRVVGGGEDGEGAIMIGMFSLS